MSPPSRLSLQRACALLVVLAVPLAVPAQTLPAPRGLELSASLGGALFSGPDLTTLSTGTGALAADVHVGIRATRRLTLGAHFGGSFLASSNTDDEVSATALAAGVYLRVYVAPHPETLGWDPWIELGVDVVSRAFFEDDRPYGDQLSFSSVTRAFSTPLRVGLDRRLSSRLAVGVSVAVTPWFASDLCESFVTRTSDDHYCVSTSPALPPDGGDPGVSFAWSASVNVRYLIPR